MVLITLHCLIEMNFTYLLGGILRLSQCILQLDSILSIFSICHKCTACYTILYFVVLIENSSKFIVKWLIRVHVTEYSLKMDVLLRFLW